jgi:hypothetical protein
MTFAVKRRTRALQCITTSQAVKCEQCRPVPSADNARHQPLQVQATSTQATSTQFSSPRWPLVKFAQIKSAALILFQ